MKKNPENPTVPKKEVPTTNKNEELQEDELNKVTGGDAGAGKVTTSPFQITKNTEKTSP